MTDMVASVTLRLRDQMNAGIDEIKSAFNGLNETIKGLSLGIEKLNHSIEALRAPVALDEGLKSAATNANATVRAINEIGASADRAAASVRAIDAAGSGGVGRGGRGGGGGGGGRSGHGHGFKGPEDAGGTMDWLGGGLAAYLGIDAMRAQANFQNPLLHTAITEKMSGPAALAEAARLQTKLQSLALKTATSSEDLAEAQLFLITTGMNKSLINQMMPALARTSTAYNVPVANMSNAAYTLNENLKIPAANMGAGLAMLAYAGKIGHFNLGDFGLFLPQVAGKAGSMGITGAAGESVLASALEITRRNTGNSGDAATDVKELLNYMTSNMGTRMFDMTKKMKSLLGHGGRALFEKYHVVPLDLPTFYNAERLKGVDPLNAMVDYFHKTLGRISSPSDRALLVGALLHNQGAQNAMIALNQYGKDFKQDQVTLGKVDPLTVQTDFATAMGGSLAQLRLFDEEMAQLERDIGQGLLIVLPPLNAALQITLGTINTLNKVVIPGLDTGLGSLAVGAGVAGLALKTLGLIKGKLLGTGAAAAGEGAAGRGAIAIAGGAAAELGVAGTGAVGLAAVGVGAAALLKYKAVEAEMKRNTDAIDRNTAAHEKFHVMGPGELYQDGPGGFVTIKVPQVHPMTGPASTTGMMLGRP